MGTGRKHEITALKQTWFCTHSCPHWQKRGRGK